MRRVGGTRSLDPNSSGLSQGTPAFPTVVVQPWEGTLEPQAAWGLNFKGATAPDNLRVAVDTSDIFPAPETGLGATGMDCAGI